MIVRQSIKGVQDANPYPDADFRLRWQHPNLDEWETIVEGTNQRVEIAWLGKSADANMIRFFGPQGVEWKPLLIVEETVRGVIEMQQKEGGRQRWRFSLRVSNGALQMDPIALDADI